MKEKLNVAIVGATGIVGQQFLVSLDSHPWFRTTKLAASARSSGKKYLDAIADPDSGSTRWYCEERVPEYALGITVEDATELDLEDVDIVFTAIESNAARELEPYYAEKVPVFSTASAFRYDEDVPIFIPGVNMDHAPLLEVQKNRRGWKGFITPNPNCTTIGLAITLAPLQEHFGIDSVHMTSLQAISGAGRSPGVIGLDIIDNVLPFIPKEEEKVERETQKILGRFEGESIAAAPFTVSCTCMRVNVREGHSESVFVSLRREVDPEAVKKAMRSFAKEFTDLRLPSSPPSMILVSDDPYRPQPRLDRDAHDGMATVVGRIRPDEAFSNGIKYVLLSHNTKMGAAKGCVLAAEYLAEKEYI